MNIVLDESVSYGLAEVLRREGHAVVAVAQSASAGNADEAVFGMACDSSAILITRDSHFTNAVRYPAEKTGGIILSGTAI